MPRKRLVIGDATTNKKLIRENTMTVGSIQRDRLTGLYTRETFFDRVRNMVSAHEEGYYIMACFDIDKFKVINDQYGMQKGDEVLKHVATIFNEGFEPHGGMCCRVSADNFAVLYPNSFSTTAKIAEIRERAAHVEGLALPIIFSIGRYIVNDINMPPEAMYDRAVLAASTIKGRYDTPIVFYNETMREHLIYEQEIAMEMKEALRDRQFEVWFQPQYNHSTHAMIGAEALVRWRHPQKGLISPNDFIPIFEKNGFIYTLDKFVWEEVCKYIRKWIDEGNYTLPVSVNVSRYDIFRGDILENIFSLIQKYEIPMNLIHFEITESAFSETSQRIVDFARELVGHGFTVGIDDFGSGYSSLNTLKDVPAQIIKLDMKFLENSLDSQRGGNIVESIVRMAKWLGMYIIAEGVETLEQANYLRSIGCNYVQGYLYARPMPADEYEEHCEGENKEGRLLALETVENLDNNAFWDPESMDTLIFNSYIGGACIYEYQNGNVELIRATEKYAQAMGNEDMTVEDVLKLKLSEHMDAETNKRFVEDFEKAIKTQKEISGEYTFIDLPNCLHETHLRSTMRVIASAGDRYLVYCTNENITEQIKSEREVNRLSEQMQTIMENIDVGILAAIREKGDAKYLFMNSKYHTLLGYTKEQFEKEVTSPFQTIAPEDRERILRETARINETGESTVIVYNALTRDKSVRTFRAAISIGKLLGIEEPVQLSIIRDITEEEEARNDLLDNLPGGAALYEYRDGNLSIVHLNKTYWELVGREAVRYDGIEPMSAAHPDDAPIILREITSAIDQHRDMTCNIRLRHQKKGYIPVRLVGRIVPIENNRYYIYTVFTPISDKNMNYQQLLPLLLSAMMEATTDMSFAKGSDFRYLSVSRAFANMLGIDNPNEIIGKTDYDLFDKELAEKYREDDEILLETGKAIVDKTEPIPSKDGTPRYASTSKYILRDGVGKIIGLYGVGRDVTKSFAQNSQLNLVNDSIPGGLATYVCTFGEFSPENVKITYFNDGFCKLFGFTREEYEKIATTDPSSMVYEEDLHILADQWRELMEADKPINCLYRAHAKGGKYKWINNRAVATDRQNDKVVVNSILQDVTDQRELIEQLRISQEESNLATKLGKNIICRYVIKDRSLTLSSDAAQSYGLPDKIYDVPYEPVRMGMISPESAEAYINFFESILQGKETATAIFQQRYFNEWRWLEATSSTVFSDRGEPVKALISFVDITEKLEKETIYRKWQQSLEDRRPESYTLFRCNLNNDNSYDTKEGVLIAFDFYSGIDGFNGRARKYADQCIHVQDRERYLNFVNSDSLLAGYYRGNRSGMIEYRENVPGGDTRWIRLSIDLVEYPNSNEIEAYLMYENIDEAKREAIQAKILSESDPLTGILNRATFAEKVNRIIQTSKPGKQHALLMFDLDGFKKVNDAFGHGAGDQALIDIATDLRAVMRHDDLVGRLGGDEFVVFLTEIPNNNVAAAKARQIGAVTRKVFSAEVQISGSVGIALVPNDGTDFESLYKNADAALYYVKGSGKDNYAFYSEDMKEQHLILEKDAAGAPTNAQSEKKRRMLIVDDNNIDHALLQNIFRENFIIEKARDGNTALIRLRHYGTAISVVLLDLMMPGMDGFAVLKEMQENPEMQHIPVIIVSGDESRDSCIKAIREGAMDFITKPVDSDILRVRVHSAISKSENERLRAKNSLLEMRDANRIRYEAALDNSGITFIEYNWFTGEFIYQESIYKYLAGNYDGRMLWQILLADMVADTRTVRSMQRLVHNIADDRNQVGGNKIVKLRTPQNETHNFRMNVHKLINEYQLTNRLVITLTDLEYDEN